jgi:Asp-tRNA(Asn)/Glu-tRNA(Gln) amidotransferase A subunit family amidase
MTHVPPQTAVDHSELGALDAVETATRIRSGELKASEAVSAAIERARTLEPALNAIPTPTFDTATRESEQPARRQRSACGRCSAGPADELCSEGSGAPSSGTHLALFEL